MRDIAVCNVLYFSVTNPDSFSVCFYIAEFSFNVILTIPVVYMALDIMILMWANPLQGPLEGVGLKFKTFF